MNINKNSWHLRIYQWWYAHKYHHPNTNGYSNLCPYMRAVMFWAPLRALFGTWIKIGKVPINAITIPALLYSIPTLLGYASYNAKVGVWVAYGGVLLVALGITTILGMFWTFDEGPLRGKPTQLVGAVASSSFWKLASEYFRSAHDRVCPEISWRNN